MILCELKIQTYNDREKILSILAHAGYKVSIQERGDWSKKEYWVVVESKEET